MNMITAPVSKTNYKLPPEGTHVARVYRLVHLGTLEQEYKGEVKKNGVIRLYWELPNEIDEFSYTKDDGTEEHVKKPFSVSREFTLSLGKKSNLRPIVEGILGTALTDEEAKTFDLEELLGKACTLSVVYKKSADGSRTYAVASSASPVMKGVDVPDAVNATQIQDVNVMSQEEIGALPDFLRSDMEISDEYKARFGEETPDGKEIKPSDIPF